MTVKLLEQQDKAIANAIWQERARQRNKIELIASENFVSQAVMEATGTVLTNRSFNDVWSGGRSVWLGDV